MKLYYISLIATFGLAVFGLIHQQLTSDDVWFNMGQFWHHESGIAIAFFCGLALIVGKWLGGKA